MNLCIVIFQVVKNLILVCTFKANITVSLKDNATLTHILSCSIPVNCTTGGSMGKWSTFILYTWRLSPSSTEHGISQIYVNCSIDSNATCSTDNERERHCLWVALYHVILSIKDRLQVLLLRFYSWKADQWTKNWWILKQHSSHLK